MEKLNIPIDELADMAGVTVEEYEAYINREDLPKATYDKINAFNKKHFTKEENDLFGAMRFIFKHVYPLSERGGKILSADGTYADPESHCGRCAKDRQRCIGKMGASI
jgi:hypothetical protein